MITPVFKDPALEQEINDIGYIVIPAFLSKEEVSSLLAIYKTYHKDWSQTCWNSHVDLPIETGAKISEHIRSSIEPKLNNLFTDWLFPYAQFISKNPRVMHDCWLHRDDSIFDEDKVEYRQLWMPLVDLTQENGALYIVPKSHKLFTDSKPMFAKWPYQYLTPALEKEYVVLYAKAGDLVIWIDKTLHGSFENFGNETRPVFQGGVIHKDTRPLFKKYIPERNEVEIYEVDPSFFLNKQYRNPIVDKKFPLLRIEKYMITPLTEEDVKAFYSIQHKEEVLGC